MIDIKSFKVGRLKTNCYLILDLENFSGVMIDPGGEIKNFEKIISSFKIEYILLTHGHFDHILNVKKYKNLTDAKIVMPEKEKTFSVDSNLNLSSRFLKSNLLESFTPDILVKEGDFIGFGKEKIKVMETPGHTQGSVCYILKNNIFSGDTLFFKTIGSTNFPTGNDEDMKKSLKKLYDLEGDYFIYPGHSKMTFLKNERENHTGF